MKPLIGFESEILARRWGVNQQTVLKWMKVKGLKQVTDIIKVFGRTSHEESMETALNDFWKWAMSEKEAPND